MLLCVYIILGFGGYLLFKALTTITGQFLSTYQEISNATRLITQVVTTLSREILCVIE